MNFKLTFLFWFIMVVIAIINGYFGQTVVAKAIGDYGAHLYKTFFIIIVIFIMSRIYVNLTAGGPVWYMPALATGIFWLCCSIIFEFLFGHYVFGFPWDKLLADYRIWEGRLWSLVLASEVIAPVINAYLTSKP